MINNYIKMAFRNLWKHKVFSIINIISLSIGLSAAFVIGMMVYYDFTFDTFHKDGDRIYRMVTDFEAPNGKSHNPGTPVPLSKEAKENITGVEESAFLYRWGVSKTSVSGSEIVLKDPDYLIFTEASYFAIFKYEWLAGSPVSALNEPNQVVLTQSRASTYFPNQPLSNAIGKTIDYGETQATITGVVADFEERTDLVFQEFISLSTAQQTDRKRQIFEEGWSTVNSSNQLFVKLSSGVSQSSVQDQLNVLSEKYQDAEMLSFGQETFFKLQPLVDIHFNENYGVYNYDYPQASKTVLGALAFIALFLLLLGIINFINLNTANATQRSREIGVRKTLGGSKKQLILQFMGETLVLTITAAIVSLILSIWLLNIFKNFIPPGITISLFLQPRIILFTVLLISVVTFLSGFYPAIILSGFKPSEVLIGHTQSRNSKDTLRKTLTVFQFTIAQVFIIGTLLVGKQIHYIMNQDMGFNVKTTAYVQTPWKDKEFSKKEVLASSLQKIPSIDHISLANMPPASFSTYSNMISLIKDGQEVKTEIEISNGDGAFLDLYEIEIIAGRKPLNDTVAEYVINQAALKKLGFTNPNDVLNQQFTMDDTSTYRIVGVMSDFNQRSLKTTIQPLAFTGDTSRKNWSQFINVHFNIPEREQGDLSSIISQIEKTYLQVYPDTDFRLNFVDEMVAGFYQREQRMAMLLNWATGLSVLISCLGLLGLVIHTTERRTKEIGIRKVLGASLAQLNVLLCKDFLVLVGIAFIIAVPLAYWGLHSWLQDFAYKTEMSWWVFVMSGVAMVVIALIIMSIRTTASAMQNPVKSLKTE